MYTKEQICNRALIMVRAPLMVSLEDNTKEAEYCRFLYPMIKTEVLNMYHWKGALRIVSLNRLDNVNSNLNYKYIYILPQDLLNIVSVNNKYNDFMYDNKYLYTNQENIEIKYIANIDEKLLLSGVVNLIVLKLALELSYVYDMGISFTNFLKDILQEEYLKQANLDSKEGGDLFIPEEDITSWISSRY